GGLQINNILEAQGKEPKYLVSQSGMKSRHTDEETLDAAIMALGGLVNKKMVAGLQASGVNAFGLTGVDGKILVARRKKKLITIDPETSKRIVVRNDYSGKIDPGKVKGKIIEGLLDAGLVPVIGALATSAEDEILNTDGDRAASCTCNAIKGDLLVSVTDVAGVLASLDDEKAISTLTEGMLDSMMEKVRGGMRKKIFAVKEALELGISKIIITSGLVEAGVSRAIAGDIGTTITP
ncbi:acetylaminoadipate kinase, partial [Candidatus Bathyarchaeota archaeon]|nr:acetylaminoadipate kinase [Candidatus Bathyarchaeota archaeon]